MRDHSNDVVLAACRQRHTPKMKGTGDPKPLLVWAPFTLDDVIEKSVIPQKCDANALHYVRA